MIEHIKKYTERGWVIHPLSSPEDKGNSSGKKPVLKGWQLLKKTPDLSMFPPGCNIGLVCGKVSGVMVIDYDSLLFASHVHTGTLVSYRTTCRGHTYFKYDPEFKSQKHHLLGIEVLSDGSNAVLPPSVHISGDEYKWVDDTAQAIEMTDIEKRRLINLFGVESELKQRISKCRACFKKVLKDYPANIPDVHGADGRQFMLAICTDLVALGAKEEHLKMFLKLMYTEKYNDQRTIQELEGIDPSKTWRCNTLMENLPAYVDCTGCVNHNHKFRNQQAEQMNMKVTIPAHVREVTLVIEQET